MKRWLGFILALAALLAGIGVWTLSAKRAPSPPEPIPGGTVKVSRPVAKGNGVVLAEEPRRLPPGGDPLRESLKALFEAGASGGAEAIPHGTRLLDARVEDGVATIDVSGEFRAIDGRGDTGESLAQNALRKTLAQFPRIRTMRVLVEGKVYEGEHSGEWTDIPVRGDGAPAGGER